MHEQFPGAFEEGASMEILRYAEACMAHAAAIESPRHRAETFALMAESARGIYHPVAEDCTKNAKQALQEAWRIPTEAGLDLSKAGAAVEWGRLGEVAQYTLDEELINLVAQKNHAEGNFLKAVLAAERQDPGLVPPDENSQNEYRARLAERNLDIALAQEITNTYDRAKTLQSIAERMNKLNSEKFVIDPGLILKADQMAWEALLEGGRDYANIENFALDRGPTFICRIPELYQRIYTIEKYAQICMERGDAEGVSWSRQQYINEMRSSRGQARTMLIDRLENFAHIIADPTLAGYIPNNMSKKREEVLLRAGVARALLENNKDWLLSFPPGLCRDGGMAALAIKRLDIDLVRHIDDSNWRLRALCEIAGRSNNYALKRHLLSTQLLPQLPNLDPVLHDSFCQLIIALRDPQMAQPLFYMNHLSPRSLTLLAVELKDAGLAASIEDKEARATALLDIAKELRDSKLIECSGGTPEQKAKAYLYLFRNGCRAT